MLQSFLIWLRIIRPQTLFASFCPVVIGLLLVNESGESMDGIVAVLTLVCALSLQILSNLVNDLYDFIRGADKANRQGFKRALAEGEVTERQMKIACVVALAVALLTGLYLVARGGWPILVIGLSAILFAWLYTATSHSLSYLGIADVFVYLYYGVIATMGTVWLQVPGEMSVPLVRQGFWAGSVCGFISMCVLMINNLRDVEDDRLVGKRTLPVRLGKKMGEILMLLIILLTPVTAWMAYHSWLVCMVVLPLLLLWFGVHRAQGKQYNKCLMLTGIINVIYVLLVCAKSLLWT